MSKIFGLLFVFFVLIGASHTAYARSDLKQVMANICDELGDNRGVKCVKLQRELENQNAVVDKNGADVCALIWKWGSQSGSLDAAADLVLSCLRQVANLRIDDEVKDTCNKPIYLIQGSMDSIGIVQEKVHKMMTCIHQLGVSSERSKSQ